MSSNSLNTSKYVDLYLSEAREHIQLIEDIIVRLPSEENPIPAIHELFRHAHSLKGMSTSMGYGAISNLTHFMEEIFSALKNNEINLTNQIRQRLMESLEKIDGMLDFIEKKRAAPEPVPHLVQALKNLINGKEEKMERPSPIRKITNEEGRENIYDITICFYSDAPLLSARAILAMKRCSEVGKVLETSPPLDKIRNGHFERQLLMKFQSPVSDDDIEKIISSLAEVEDFTISLDTKSYPKKETSKESLHIPNVRIKTEYLDHFLNESVELMIHQEKLARIIEKSQNYEARYEVEQMEKSIKKLYSNVAKARMLPFSFLSQRFEKSVQELANSMNKKISLKILGGETELDRSILEAISDPINHLIRNSIDHGIEDTATRKRLKKDETGQIIISLIQKSDSTEISIEDDGSGINLEKVKRLALQEGYITKGKYKTIPEQEAFMLLTIPGFSTVKKLTTLSGRGIGLDVVRTKIENIGGKMKITSRLGGGTSIIFSLPLTIALINAFIVRSGEYQFAVPVSSIERTIRIPPSDIIHDEANRAFLIMDGIATRVYDLSSILLSKDEQPSNDQPKPIFIFKLGETLAGLSVDEILSRKKIIVKPLGPPIDQLREYSGVSLLEKGDMALILDISNILSI